MKVCSEDGVLKSYFDLVPHSPTALLHEPKFRFKNLELYHFLLVNLIEAIDAFFMRKKYDLFDPHVGDTLCQIRAMQILLVVLNYKGNIEQALISLTELQLKTEYLLSVMKTSYLKKRSVHDRRKENRQTLEEFFRINELSFEIDEELDYVLKSYLLTKYKVQKNKSEPRINYKQLIDDGCFSKDMAVRLVRHWQKSLAAYSYACLKLVSPDIAELLRRYDDDGRLVLPSFFVMKGIIAEIKKNKFTVLINVRNPDNEVVPSLQLTFQSENNDFVLSSDSVSQNKCFVVQAISYSLDQQNRQEFIKKLLSFGIETLFLTSCANHPQYSGTKLAYLNQVNAYQQLFLALKRIFKNDVQIRGLNELDTLSRDYEEMKKLAISNQCSYLKPNFVFIEHMYAKI